MWYFNHVFVQIDFVIGFEDREVTYLAERANQNVGLSPVIKTLRQFIPRREREHWLRQRTLQQCKLFFGDCDKEVFKQKILQQHRLENLLLCLAQRPDEFLLALKQFKNMLVFNSLLLEHQTIALLRYF